ncbi:transposase [Ferruginibacter sp.]
MTKLKEWDAIKRQRLEKAITKEEKYKEQKRHFGLMDTYLDKNFNKPYWLRDNDIAAIVSASLHFGDGKLYKLWSYCIMPNHVHLVITTLKDAPPLYTIMQRHKRHTAVECNKVLRRIGKFWTHESYDHIVRKEGEFKRIIFYTINNPVKAGLIKNWKEWKWTYVDPELGF